MIFSSGKKTLSRFVSFSSREGFSTGSFTAPSSTRRLNTGARSRRSRVHSVNSTSHASSGSTQVTRERTTPPSFGAPRNGEVSRRSGWSRASTSRMSSSESPLPQLPAYSRSSVASSSAPSLAREPWPLV